MRDVFSDDLSPLLRAPRLQYVGLGCDAEFWIPYLRRFRSINIARLETGGHPDSAWEASLPPFRHLETLTIHRVPLWMLPFLLPILRTLSIDLYLDGFADELEESFWSILKSALARRDFPPLAALKLVHWFKAEDAHPFYSSGEFEKDLLQVGAICEARGWGTEVEVLWECKVGL